jgi:hypothetical protein
VPDLESMFRNEMLKILLQQYLPGADSGTAVTMSTIGCRGRAPRRLMSGSHPVGACTETGWLEVDIAAAAAVDRAVADAEIG